MPTEKGGGAGGGERRGGSGGARKSRDGPGNVGRRGGGGKQQPGDGDGAKGNDPDYLPLPDNHVPATNSTGKPPNWCALTRTYILPLTPQLYKRAILSITSAAVRP